MSATERERIRQTVLDYFEGWYDGDVARMDRALHPDLVKRWPGTEHAASLPVTTKLRMLELAAQGEGAQDAGDRRIDITIEDLADDIASVTVRTVVYHEYLQLVLTDDGWRIANALWRYAPPP